MQRYFVNQTYHEALAQGFALKGNDYHHAVNVMRMKEQEKCYLVFTDQVAITSEVVTIYDDTLLLKELTKEEQLKELPIEVTIACGYPKGDKLDLVVQKGTELGAAAFIGFPCQSSVVKWDNSKRQKRQERLTKIAKEAAEQSHRQMQPTVQFLAAKGDLLTKFSEYDDILIAYEEAAKTGEKAQLVETLETLKIGQRLLVVFGPEGGFSPQEIELFQAAGAKICGLGPRILRAETAPLYLLSAVSYKYELQKN